MDPTSEEIEHAVKAIEKMTGKKLANEMREMIRILNDPALLAKQTPEDVKAFKESLQLMVTAGKMIKV